MRWLVVIIALGILSVAPKPSPLSAAPTPCDVNSAIALNTAGMKEGSIADEPALGNGTGLLAPLRRTTDGGDYENRAKELDKAGHLFEACISRHTEYPNWKLAFTAYNAYSYSEQKYEYAAKSTPSESHALTARAAAVTQEWYRMAAYVADSSDAPTFARSQCADILPGLLRAKLKNYP